MEERAEQLKAISNLSALIAGFALVSFLQFDFDPNASSEGVQLAFGLTIALTVRASLFGCVSVLFGLSLGLAEGVQLTFGLTIARTARALPPAAYFLDLLAQKVVLP